MIWYVLMASAIAIGLLELGALSVWVLVLSLTLRIMLVLVLAVVLGGVAFFVWRRFQGTNMRQE